jgi:hypothetical protein
VARSVSCSFMPTMVARRQGVNPGGAWCEALFAAPGLMPARAL